MNGLLEDCWFLINTDFPEVEVSSTVRKWAILSSRKWKSGASWFASYIFVPAFKVEKLYKEKMVHYTVKKINEITHAQRILFF